MRYKSLAAFAAATIIVAAASMTPVNAAKKHTRPRSDTGNAQRNARETPSLDGRVLGYPRTCGFEALRYEIDGIPIGPYCH
jgi:hypothetical protein